MTIPLDRNLRKELVKLAEKNPDFRTPARVVLGLAANRSNEEIAKAARVQIQEVEQWRQQYDSIGLGIFKDVLPPDLIGEIEEDVVETVPVEADDMAPIEFEIQPIEPVSSRPPAEPQQQEIPPQVAEVEPPLVSAQEPQPPELPQPEAATPPKPKPRRPQLEELLPPHAPDPTKPISIGALAAAFDVDMRFVNHVSQQARELFHITAEHHRLAGHLHNLLHAAALLQKIGKRPKVKDFETKSRDIVLHYDFKEINKDERQRLAAIIGLQNPDSMPKQDIAFRELPEGTGRSTEMLIGLFRIALGLTDSNQKQSSILEWHEVPGEITIVLGGKFAAEDARKAEKNATLWNNLYGMPQLRFVTESQAADDSTVDDLKRWASLNIYDSSIEVSNALRHHYSIRFDYLVERIRRNDSGLLVPLWREFQRLTGIWLWLLPGSKPRQVFNEDTEWISNLIQTSLFYATLEDRTDGLLNETDQSKDDPQAVHELKTLAVYHAEQAANAFDELRNALRGRRYMRWLNSVRTDLRDSNDTVTFGSQVGVRAWAYLSELRQVIDHVNSAGMNADLEELLTLAAVQTFEMDLRLLTDLLFYSANLLGVEIEQVLHVLEPLSGYLQAWQRMEQVAQYAEQIKQVPPIELSGFVLDAFAFLMRERANEMRWNLVDMWEPIETIAFRRALALAIAKP